MPEDQLVHATRRMVAASEAIGRFFQRYEGQPLPSDEAEPLLAEDHDARKAYAEALEKRGWTVPHGLLRY